MARLSLSFDALRKLFGWKLDKDDEEEEEKVVEEKLMAPSSEPFDFDTIPTANSVIESQEDRVRKANEKALEAYANLFCPERMADICRKIFEEHGKPYMPTSRVINFVTDLADPDLCKAIQTWRNLYTHDFQFDLKEEFSKPWKPLLDKGWAVDLHAYTTEIHDKTVANIYLSVEAKLSQIANFNLTVDVF